TVLGEALAGGLRGLEDADHVEDRDLGGTPRKAVAAAHATGPQSQSRADHPLQDLRQWRFGDSIALGHLRNGDLSCFSRPGHLERRVQGIARALVEVDQRSSPLGMRPRGSRQAISWPPSTLRTW